MRTVHPRDFGGVSMLRWLFVGLEAHCKSWKEVDEQSELGRSMPTWKGKHEVWIIKILDKDEENTVNWKSIP
jgi:hypothetical protein